MRTLAQGAEWTLIDEGATPSLRERFERRLVEAASADFAVARIRLAALDLTPEEIDGTARWRVLLGELDAAMLLDAYEGVRSDHQRATLARLRAFAGSGRLEVRSAGLGCWAPDFAIIRGREDAGPAGDAGDAWDAKDAPDGQPNREAGPEVLGVLGAIYFGRPRPAVGPSLTAVTRDAEAVALMARRFVELWDRAHDVLPAIVDVLDRAHGVAAGLAADRR